MTAPALDRPRTAQPVPTAMPDDYKLTNGRVIARWDRRVVVTTDRGRIVTDETYPTAGAAQAQFVARSR